MLKYNREGGVDSPRGGALFGGLAKQEAELLQAIGEGVFGGHGEDDEVAGDKKQEDQQKEEVKSRASSHRLLT